MIARRYIEEWKANAPWPDNAQVEQDLIIELIFRLEKRLGILPDLIG